MKIEKVFSLLFVISLLTMMSFTSFAEEWSWEKAAEPYKGETLYVLLQSHPAVEATQELIEDFEEKTGINVEIETLQRRAMNTREEMELSSTTPAYDVTHIAPPKRLRYKRANWVTSLDKYINNSDLTSPDFNFDDFIEPYLNTLKVDDTLYGLPFSGEATLFYYRKDIFEENNISNPPDTINELEQICSRINSEETPAFATRAVRGQGVNVFTWVSFLKAYGGDFFDEEYNPVLDSNEAIKATEKYAELLQKYGPHGVSSYSHYEVSTDFAQGKLATAIAAGPWGGSVFSNPEKSKIIGKWAASPLPAGPEGRYPEVYTHGLMIPENTQKKEAAWLFIQWFTSKKTQTKRATIENGSGDVTRKSVFNDSKYKERYDFGNWRTALLESVTKYAQESRPNELPEWMEVGDRIGAAVQAVIAGDASAEEAMKNANEDIKELMEEAGYY